MGATGDDAIRLMGIDPGLRATGWGIVAYDGRKLSPVANGTITSDASRSLGDRLVMLETGLLSVMAEFAPDEAAVETAFVARDASAALKLGQARAVALLVPARAGLVVAEYAPNQIKKTVVGAGHADKQQIRKMINVLLPRCEVHSEHSADALATAVCHAHMRQAQSRIEAAEKRAYGAARGRV